MTPITVLREALAKETSDPAAVAEACIARANGNVSRNTYLHFDEAALRAQAHDLPGRFLDPAVRPPLYGIPVSLKDCFDLAGTATTCGSEFYAQRNSMATRNSAVAQRLIDAGCLITGKTHLHPLAYGITGQNADYGDCLQPRDAELLTGGSSSGAAASVQEGSALVAIGTDTGGSIRVPAALCGLAGYRASHQLACEVGGWPNLWEGAAHLAPSFDTLGVLFRDVRDAPLLAHALFGVPLANAPGHCTIGCVPDSFLFDSEPEVRHAYRDWKIAQQEAGATLADFDVPFWQDSVEIFAGIQAHEAAAIHRGHFHYFEAAIGQRLAWGESLTGGEVARLRARRRTFEERVAALFSRFDLLALPCAPVTRLRRDADPSAARQAILRYTTPFSLAGLPVVALPGGDFGTGIQLATAPGNDGALLAFAAIAGGEQTLF